MSHPDVKINPDEHVWLIYYVAKYLMNNSEVCRTVFGTDRREYLGYGYMALLRAARNYKPSHGCWSKYAYAAIRNTIRNQAHALRGPVHIANAARNEAWRVGQGKGRSKNSKVREKNLNAALAWLTAENVGSAVNQTGARAHGEWNRAPRFEVEEAVEHAKRVLSERELLVVRHRFGLDGYEEMTLEEVGVILKLTRERVRQIEGEAINKMRKKLG